MKTTFLVIAFIGCIALGLIDAKQVAQLRAKDHELLAVNKAYQELAKSLEEKTDAIENAKLTEAKSRILQQTLAESTSATAAQSKKSEELKQSLDEAQTNNPMHAMASMFKDPKMRDMMKAQQKAVLGPMIEKQYSDLFKQLNLTPEQSAALKDLVGKKMLVGADAGFSMLDDSLDAAQRADLTKQIKTQTDEYDQQIKDFLGDNYPAYQTYEKTVPDRMTVNQFNDQFAGTPTALTPTQQQQLVQALSDARNNFTWNSGLNQQNPGANGDLAAMLTEDNIAKFVSEREQFDSQFIPKLQPILTPEQITAYTDFQKAQRDIQVMGLKMAGQMFNAQKK
jgi:hypothetical protein